MPGLAKVFGGAILITAALVGTAAHAEGDIQRGSVLADTCLGCHGIPGYRNAYPSYRVPKLGGQHEEYLFLALQGYKNETRTHLTMQAQTATLSEQDMRDLAAFFASQGSADQSGGGSSSKGKEKVAVCTACHGATGIAPTANWPTLAGQHQDYLEEVIIQYKDGTRTDPVMAGLVTNLSDEDIADIAAYYAAQKGLFTADYGN